MTRLKGCEASSVVRGSFSFNPEWRKIILWPSAADDPPEGHDPMALGAATGDISPRWRWEIVIGKLPLCPQLPQYRPAICHHPASPIPGTPRGQRPDQPSFNRMKQPEEHIPSLDFFDFSKRYKGSTERKHTLGSGALWNHSCYETEFLSRYLESLLPHHTKGTPMSSLRKLDWEFK